MRDPFGLFSLVSTKFNEAKTFFEEKQREIDVGIKTFFKVEEKPTTTQQNQASNGISNPAQDLRVSAPITKLTIGGSSTPAVTITTQPVAQIPMPTFKAQTSSQEYPRAFFNRLSKEGINSQILTGGNNLESKNYLKEKIAFWSKELNKKQINPAQASILPMDKKETYLVTYAKFLSENIKKTRAESLRPQNSTNENYLALLTAQELELAKMRYICCPEADDQKRSTNSQQKIYNFLSPEAKNYAIRQGEKKLRTDHSRSDGLNLSAEENFIKGIAVPRHQFYSSNFTTTTSPSIHGGTTVRTGDSRSDKLDKLSKDISTLHKESRTKSFSTRKNASTPTSTPASIAKATSASNLSSNEIAKYTPTLEQKALFNKINGVTLNEYINDVNQVTERPLIIAEKSLEKRMAQIEVLMGLRSSMPQATQTLITKEDLNANQEVETIRENSLVEYTKFLAEKIKLANSVIKHMPRTSEDPRISKKEQELKYENNKKRLEKLQFGLLSEIIKIRAGVFPDREMSQAKKSEEARNLTEHLEYKHNFIPTIEQTLENSEKIRHGRIKGGDFKPYSQRTLKSVDKTIKSLEISLNTTSQLEYQVYKSRI